jgi:hypothetical protein
MVEITGVSRGTVPSVWPLVYDLLKSATVRAGYMPEDIYDELTEGYCQMVLAVEGNGAVQAVCITEIYEELNRKVCNIRVLAGYGRGNWMTWLSDMETWARNKGCDEIQVAEGRMGWMKILKPWGYKPAAVKMVKALK